MVDDLKAEIFFTVEVIIKRPLWHSSCVEDFLKARVIEPLEMDELRSCFKDILFGIGLHNLQFPQGFVKNRPVVCNCQPIFFIFFQLTEFPDLFREMNTKPRWPL
jgi:hypothetical protein